MFDIAGGAALINKAASMAATQAGKKVAAMLGQKITRQTVGSAVTKVVPVLGVVAGTLTYAIFRPKKDLKNELNPEFLKELEEQDELSRV